VGGEAARSAARAVSESETAPSPLGGTVAEGGMGKTDRKVFL